jgi:uncharacterized membrane protein YdjX (TVP38/TMEM64 family)
MSTITARILMSRLLRISVAMLLAAGVMLVATHWEMLDPRVVRVWVAEAGVLAPLLFMMLFAASAMLFIPSTIMVLAGGALFGPWLGLFYNMTGATIGAVFAFLISRYLVRDMAQRWAGHRLRLMMQGVRDGGWKFVVAIRLAGVPYFVLNYLLGLTSLGIGQYTFASFIAMLPATAAMTYAGHTGFQVIGAGEGVLGKVILTISLIGMVALIPLVAGILRKTRRGGIPGR